MTKKTAVMGMFPEVFKCLEEYESCEIHLGDWLTFKFNKDGYEVFFPSGETHSAARLIHEMNRMAMDFMEKQKEKGR